MSRVWFAQALETVAVWWRIERRDGVALGLTGHDRDLVFAGLRHRTAPGMVPSAVRRTATFEPDSAEVKGALSHDATGEAVAGGGADHQRVRGASPFPAGMGDGDLFLHVFGAPVRMGGQTNKSFRLGSNDHGMRLRRRCR